MSSPGTGPQQFDQKGFDEAFTKAMGIGSTQGATPSPATSTSQSSPSPSPQPSPESPGSSPGGGIDSETIPGQAMEEPTQGSPEGGETKQSLFRRMLEAVKHPGDIAAGLTAGLLRAPGQAVGGALDTERDIAGAVGGEAGKAGFDKAVDIASPYGVASYLLTGSWQHKGTYQDVLSARDTLGRVGFNGLNQATANVAGIALGMAAVPEAEGLAGGLKLAQGAGRFGLAAGVVSPSGPNQERFANALSALGVHTEFTDWLSASPAQESPMEARFKNAVDGALGGAAAEMVFNTAKYAWSIARGAPDAAALAASKSAAEAIVPENARPSEMVTKAVKRGEGPQPETSVEGPAPTTESSQVGLDDAAKAGALNTDNSQTKFFVKPSGEPDGSYRLVGSMDKDDLARLYARANELKGKSSAELDISATETPELHAGLGQVTFNSPDDVAPFMRALLENAPRIDRPISDESRAAIVADLAKSMGVDGNAAENFLAGFAKEAKSADIGARLAKTIWAGTVNRVMGNAYQGALNLSKEDLDKHLSDVYTASSIGSHWLDIKAGLSRGTRALGLPPIDIYKEAFNKPAAEDIIPFVKGTPGTIPPLPRNLSELQDFYELWKATGGEAGAMADLLQGKVNAPDSWKYLRSSFASNFTASLLAGKAIVKGFLFPGFLGTIRTLEKTSGSLIKSLDPSLSSEERSQYLAIARAAPQGYLAASTQMISAARFMLQAMKRGGTSVIGGGYSAKDATQRLGPITDQLLYASGAQPNWKYTLGNAINLWPRAVFSLIGGHDELTKRIGYYGETYVQASADAAKQGLKGDDAASFVREALKQSIDPMTGAATNPEILNRAAASSLIQKSYAGSFSSKAINATDAFRNEYPESRYILPVFDVPAHNMGSNLGRIPILNLAFKETRDDLEGLNGQVPQAEAYGRMLTGGTLLATGFSLARAGQLTGAGPSDYRQRDTWLKDHQPYSIKVPGIGWLSYKDWPGVGMVLGIMGGTYDSTVYEAADKGWSGKMWAGVAGIAEFMKDQAALQQISNVLDFGGDPKASKETIQRIVRGTSSGFIPAFVKYIRNMDDPDRRQETGWFRDSILNSIPGQSQKLDPMRNIMGEPLHIPNDTLLENVLPITIAPTTPDSEDTVDREISDMYERTGYAPGVTSQATLLHGYEDARQLKLEDGRSLYDHFMDARQDKIGEDQDGNDANVREALKSLFASDDYKEANYGSATSSGDILGEASKLHMVKQVFDEFNKAAKQKVAQDSPTARRYLASAQIKSTSPDLFGGRSLNDIAHGEPLLQSLGIDIKDYEDAQTGQ